MELDGRSKKLDGRGGVGNRHNRQFKDEMERIIRDTPGHPLAFLLGPDGRLRSAYGGKRAILNGDDGVIQEITIGQNGFASDKEFREFLESTDSTSISVDTCHVTCKNFGGAALALGIAESNKADGAIEKHTIIDNEVIDICGAPVLRQHAEEWASRQLLDAKYISSAPPSQGWTPPRSRSSAANNNGWGSITLPNAEEAAARQRLYDRLGWNGE